MGPGTFAGLNPAGLLETCQKSACGVVRGSSASQERENGKATGELLPGVVIVSEREHFGVSFGHAGMPGKDSSEQDSMGDQ